MPPKRHKIINKSRELNANLEEKKDKLNREAELAERELSELEETGEDREETRVRLKDIVSERMKMIEAINDLRKVFVSIIEDHNYLTDDNLDAMYQEGGRRTREFMQEIEEPEKAQDSESDSENEAEVRAERKEKRSKKNPNRRKKEERAKKRSEKRRGKARNKNK